MSTPPSPRGARAPAEPPPVSRAQLAAYFLKLGALGFGGPAALVRFMRRDLVEERGWFTPADFNEGMALAQLAPGPLATQLAIYLGYIHHRVAGATLAGVAFVAPSFVVVVALGWAYQHYGGLGWVQAVFYGVGACVIGIIAHSAYQLTTGTIGRDRLLWPIWLLSALCTVVMETEYVVLFLASGLLVWLVRRPRRHDDPTAAATALVPLAAWAQVQLDELTRLRLDIVLFFAKAGSFVFGSGLAIVPFLYGGVVNEHHWLDEGQFLDAVAVAMITPGPVVISVGFIGYLVDGLVGASLAAVATFLPCYLLTVIPAPYFRKYGSRPGIAAFVDGVTAAAIGAIGGAVVVLGRRTLFDGAGQVAWPKVAILAAALAILSWGRRVPEPLLVLAAALVGLAIYPYVGP